MVENTAGSTVPRRTLGRGLREAREAKGILAKKAAEELDFSTQKLWRMESGQVPVTVSDVRAMCFLYGLDAKATEDFIALSKETKSKGWWVPYGDAVPRWFEAYVGMEQSAARIRGYELTLIPGLLQSREYMSYLCSRDDPDPVELEKRISLRLQRQGLFTRSFPPPPTVEFMIGEAALRVEPPEPGVMRAQLWHLLKATELPQVSVKVVPINAGPHDVSVAGAFVMLDFPTGGGERPEPPTVYSENLTGALYLDKPAEISQYEKAWRTLDAFALSDADSVELLGGILKEWNDRESV
jgi:transcriptional regulator with XRE-family HTH domain